MDQTQWDNEANFLMEIYQKISTELTKRREEVEGYHKSIMTIRRSLWEDGDHGWEYGDTDAAVEIKQSMDVLQQETRKYDQAAAQLLKLERLIKSPYFGRIDFIEEGLKYAEKIYIGITSFFEERGEILIYDWRAPISSIFYDHELGPAAYECLDGIIKGQVTLKRQYRVFEDQLLNMFDTGIKIDDELLQEILSKNVDEKMRNIVNTIQKEQNRIIRDETHQLLMVQGVAGSGKTSIALHRIAYMLYKYREEKMTSNNILIFSPNTVFNDYISNVLPELGEENMQQTTFYEYIEKNAGKDLAFENSSEHMEYILSVDESIAHLPRLRGITYKSSMEFYTLMNDYAYYLEHETLHFEDITFKDQILIPLSEINRLLFEDYATLPLARRLEKLRYRLYYMIRPARLLRLKELEEQLSENPDYKGKIRAFSRLYVYKEFKDVRKKIEAMLEFDTTKAFMELFSNEPLFKALTKENLPENYKEICEDTISRLQQNKVGYEDISAYVYLKGILEGVPSMSHIRHVLVDEAQDYTPIQYGILKQLFPSTRMTLLGDFNQTINPLRETFNYQMVADILLPHSHALLKLTKGFRSTSDIVSFTRSILGNDQEIESIQRKGDKPCVIHGNDEKDLINNLILDIQELISNGFESVGVICKTAVKSKWLYNEIRKALPAVLVTSDDTNFSKGIVVMPVYLAKGLEFDASVVYQSNAESYGKEQDRRLFYTACTRALHKLNLYYTGDVSPFITAISPDYFVHKSIIKH